MWEGLVCKLFNDWFRHVMSVCAGVVVLWCYMLPDQWLVQTWDGSSELFLPVQYLPERRGLRQLLRPPLVTLWWRSGWGRGSFDCSPASLLLHSPSPGKSRGQKLEQTADTKQQWRSMIEYSFPHMLPVVNYCDIHLELSNTYTQGRKISISKNCKIYKK